MSYNIQYCLSPAPTPELSPFLTADLISIPTSHHSPLISLGFQENGKEQIYKKTVEVPFWVMILNTKLTFWAEKK